MIDVFISTKAQYIRTAPLLVALVILTASRLNILSREEMQFVLTRFTGGKPLSGPF